MDVKANIQGGGIWAKLQSGGRFSVQATQHEQHAEDAAASRRDPTIVFFFLLLLFSHLLSLQGRHFAWGHTSVCQPQPSVGGPKKILHVHSPVGAWHVRCSWVRRLRLRGLPRTRIHSASELRLVRWIRRCIRSIRLAFVLFHICTSSPAFCQRRRRRSLHRVVVGGSGVYHHPWITNESSATHVSQAPPKGYKKN